MFETGYLLRNLLPRQPTLASASKSLFYLMMKNQMKKLSEGSYDDDDDTDDDDVDDDAADRKVEVTTPEQLLQILLIENYQGSYILKS